VTAPVIETHGLVKRFGRRRPVVAVDDVDLAVRPGEVYGFLGPNGAGKTTTLRMVLGLVRPTSGTASVLGEPAGSRAALARTGAMIEGPAFYPYLSGADNLRVLARYAGVPAGRVRPALASVDLDAGASDAFSSYSLGMKQRLGVAAALLKDPDVVVLDEPTNGLDPAGMRDMRGLVVDLGRQGRTVILSSHLMAEVQEVCDRVGVIVRGRLVVESTVEELRGGSELRLTTTRPMEAREVVAALPFVSHVHTLGDDLGVRVAEPDTPELVRRVVAAGIDVHEVRRVERELEDVFFELTGSSDVSTRSALPAQKASRA
jgi:ABC-2 type transport system ATP-binding protein